MLRGLLICAALLFTAVAGPASALPACWKCCPGTGFTPEGHCFQICSATCGGHLPRLMRSTKQCDAQYRLLSCNGAHCQWRCGGN